MRIIRPPGLLKRISSKWLHWQIPASEKTLYLTFDDGPTPGVTEKVLDILKLNQAWATFFCLGKNVEKQPELFSRILSEGHAIGNHTYSHLNSWKTSVSDYLKDVAKFNTLYQTELFRPPYGRLGINHIKDLSANYKIVMWSILSYDFDKKLKPQQCFENIVRNAKPGSIIVFHDSIKASENCLRVLPEILGYFSQRNYEFKPIDLSAVELWK